MGIISENVYSVLAELPRGVELVAAAKTRTPKEINEAIDAGLSTIGENYIQEAEAARATIGAIVNWHFIGSLQNNKVKKAVRLFDLIETVDSVALARAIGNEGLAQGKIMPGNGSCTIIPHILGTLFNISISLINSRVVIDTGKFAL